MGHSNTNCLISGISISNRPVLCIILAKTKKVDTILGPNHLFYPLTVPIYGNYSPSKFGLVSYQNNRFIQNLLDQFKKGIRLNKIKDFNLISLLDAIADTSQDTTGDRGEWFDPNHGLYKLTDRLNLCYVDYEVFLALKKLSSINKSLNNFISDVETKLLMEEASHYLKKPGSTFWSFGSEYNQLTTPLFYPVNRSVFKDLKKDSELKEPLKNLLIIDHTLQIKGAGWVPPGHGPQDGENQFISKINQEIIKIIKTRKD